MICPAQSVYLRGASGIVPVEHQAQPLINESFDQEGLRSLTAYGVRLE